MAMLKAVARTIATELEAENAALKEKYESASVSLANVSRRNGELTDENAALRERTRVLVRDVLRVVREEEDK